jgi:hypothetical protein
MDQPEDVLQKYDRLARERFGRRRGAVVARFGASTGPTWEQQQLERIRERHYGGNLAQPQQQPQAMPAAAPLLPMPTPAPRPPALPRAASRGDVMRLYQRYQRGRI